MLAVSGCGAGEAPRGAAKASAEQEAAPAPTRSLPRTVEARCKIPAKGDVVQVPAPGGMLSAGVVGEGKVGAVLLHQTSGAGFCGWATYGQWLADKGVNVVMLDVCNYGQSQCDDALTKDWVAQIKAGIDFARSRGATTVTVVGASLGGVLALGAGEQAGADAIVNLSGPSEWEGVPDAMAAAKATTVPLLISAADADTGIEVDVLKAAVAASPAAHKRYVPMPGEAHGWTGISNGMSIDPVFEPLATTVLQWIQGDYGH
ncbi:alpha/beta hydrolase family protein [Knoellia sp. CPCC 206453]|uniref:alpha/beta hydrolase family protein n=1 Tax=Knoellia pratensis TaxID=3404796 RepID=UPI0036072EA8